MDSQFLPAPLLVTYTPEGVKIPNPSVAAIDPAKQKFPRLAVQRMLNDSLLPSETLSYLKIPYDLYCPSVQSVLSERMCKSCEQYFASKVMLQQHVSQHKRPPLVPATRARPQRIAARRQRELMVVIAEQENAQSIDWLDESEVVFEGLLPSEDAEGSEVLPKIPLSKLSDTSDWFE
jgi:hypothetical protein